MKTPKKQLEISSEDWNLLLVAFLLIFIMCFFIVIDINRFPDFSMEFIAVVLGLLLVFGIQRKTEQRKREQNRKDIMQQIHGELQQTKKKLTGTRFPESLQVPIWDSAASSGQLSLLGMEQLKSLTELYNLIKDVDRDAQKVREIHVEYEKSKPSGRKLEILLNKYADNHRILENQLHERINKMLRADWWKTFDVSATIKRTKK